MKQKYVVIDLEATGHKFEEGDRIFQIGCVLIDDDKIVQEIDFLVNPETEIPYAVEQLTGVSNDEVVDAPYFDEIATLLHTLIDNRIVIAHNVRFDYPFLVKSFKELAGIEWSADCIDTVQLSQICLPTAEGYRLSDLSRMLNIPHQKVHSAGSDASATAHLFLYLHQKIMSLPAQTIGQLSKFSDLLIDQTGELFQSDNSLTQGDSIELILSPKLRKKNPTIMKTVDSPLTLYHELVRQKKIRYSLQQETMITYLDQRMNNDYPLTWLEAEPGVGKTLAYLLVAMAHATVEKPVWIVTSTLLLQHQLLEQELVPILEALDITVPFTTIKGQQHYISLSGMKKVLQQPEVFHAQKYAIPVMALLVWLTETTTGDLTECHSSLMTEEIWELITKRERKKDVYDYYKQAYSQALQSPLVITNHAYIARHLPTLRHKEDFKLPIVLVDEVQQLESALEQQTQTNVNFEELWSLQQRWYDYHLEEHIQWNDQNDFVSRKINRLLLEICDLYEEWKESVQNTGVSTNIVFSSTKDWKSTYHFQTLQAIKKALIQLLKEYRRFTASPTLTYISHQLTEMLVRQIVRVTTINEGYVTVEVVNNKGQTSLQITALKPAIALWRELLDGTQQFFGISATIPQHSPLFYQVVNEDDFFKLSKQEVLFPHKVFLPTDLPVPIIEMSDEDVQNLASWIWKIYQRQHARMLVLVHSMNVLERIETYLNDWTHEKVTLLVQRMPQSSRKIQRKFQQEEQVILLGLASFWEGFDSGDVSIDQLVITKLPFPNPVSRDQLVIAEELHEQGREYFFDYALPQMLQQFYQGLGRLCRPQQSTAEIWVLDVRASKSQYAADVRSVIPKEATIISKSFKKMLKFN